MAATKRQIMALKPEDVFLRTKKTFLAAMILDEVAKSHFLQEKILTEEDCESIYKVSSAWLVCLIHFCRSTKH